MAIWKRGSGQAGHGQEGQRLQGLKIGRTYTGNTNELYIESALHGMCAGAENVAYKRYTGGGL